MNCDRFPPGILICSPDFLCEGRAEDNVLMMKMRKAMTTVWSLWGWGMGALGEAVGRVNGDGRRLGSGR